MCVLFHVLSNHVFCLAKGVNFSSSYMILLTLGVLDFGSGDICFCGYTSSYISLLVLKLLIRLSTDYNCKSLFWKRFAILGCRVLPRLLILSFSALLARSLNPPPLLGLFFPRSFRILLPRLN